MANVLIVEDEKGLREAYSLVLDKAGHKVDAVANGLEALDAFKAKSFDMVLLDLRMPRMDGVEFLKKLSPREKFPDTKIIIFSNYDDQKEVAEALEHGATRYILKAWSSPNELMKVVQETLAED